MQPSCATCAHSSPSPTRASANRAGAALFRAQSAVSRSIHKLKRELGVELFERRARGRLLTEHGVDTASVARRNR